MYILPTASATTQNTVFVDKPLSVTSRDVYNEGITFIRFNMNNKHLIKCWLWKGLWVVAAVLFAMAWVSVMRRAAIAKLDPLFLLWSALIFGVLSIPIKLDCHSCDVCGVKGVPHM